MVPVSLSPAKYGSSSGSTCLLLTIDFVILFNFSNSSDVVLTCISMMSNNTEHLLCVYWPVVCSWGSVCQVVCPFVLCLSFYYWVLGIKNIYIYIYAYMYILDTSSLSHIGIADINIQVCGLCFYFLNYSFWWAYILLLLKSYLPIFSLIVKALCVL